jgi:hypothetical protein
MRDAQLLAEWLAYTAHTLKLVYYPSEEAQAELAQRVASNRDVELWRLLRADGWTVEELTEKYMEVRNK